MKEGFFSDFPVTPVHGEVQSLKLWFTMALLYRHYFIKSRPVAILITRRIIPIS
jgi:hypothetical protein